MKKLLWVLLGVVIGGGGVYFITKTPDSNVVKPTSPTNIAMMFKQAVDANSLSSLQALMTPQQQHNFTGADLQSIRQYIGVGTKAEAGSSLNNYEVLTFGNGESITLWLVPPTNKNQMWEIQQVTQGIGVNGQ